MLFVKNILEGTTLHHAAMEGGLSYTNTAVTWAKTCHDIWYTTRHNSSRHEKISPPVVAEDRAVCILPVISDFIIAGRVT